MDLIRHARAHYGLITMKEWKAAGRSRSAWYRALDGELLHAGAGVARYPAVKVTPEQRILAAVWANPDSVASHRSAAYLWGADLTGDRPVDLIGRTGSARLSSENVTVHRPRDRKMIHAVPRRGIATTHPIRTLLDLGAVAANDVGPALQTFLVSKLITIEGLESELAQRRKSGRPGIAAVATALDALPLGTRPDSVLEFSMAGLLRRVAGDDWEFHPRVGPYELDFSLPEFCIGIEVDGWRFHAARFEEDREKSNYLAGRGWLVLRYTWRMIRDRPRTVEASIRAAIAARSPLTGGSQPDPAGDSVSI